MDAVEGLVFDKLNLTQPWQRFGFGFGVASAVVWFVKPDSMFNPDGSARSWQVTSADNQTSTMTPWFLPGVLVGGLAATFI